MRPLPHPSLLGKEPVVIRAIRAIFRALCRSPLPAAKRGKPSPNDSRSVRAARSCGPRRADAIFFHPRAPSANANPPKRWASIRRISRGSRPTCPSVKRASQPRPEIRPFRLLAELRRGQGGIGLFRCGRSGCFCPSRDRTLVGLIKIPPIDQSRAGTLHRH